MSEDTINLQFKRLQKSWLRILVGCTAGFAVVIFLFWFMMFLITFTETGIDDSGKTRFLDFVRVKRNETPERKKNKPEKPPLPEAPPKQPPTPKLDQFDASAEKLAVSAAPVETNVELNAGGFSIGAIGEGEYLPIVKVAPIYPERAAARGIEGFCTVSYTVSKQGTTTNVVVVPDECSSSLFHRSSIRAAGKFKYKPRIKDGEAIEVHNVRNKFTYQLEGGR
jgi:protein TonB